jgi:hypothetical protein
MEDLHEAFKERVRGSRGERLAAGKDDELFSGKPCGRLVLVFWRWEARRHAHTHTDGDLVPVPDVVQAAPGQAGRH